jgi:hypothetical protein
MNAKPTLAIDELLERSSTRTWFVPVLLNETEIPSIPISLARGASVYAGFDAKFDRAWGKA